MKLYYRNEDYETLNKRIEKLSLYSIGLLIYFHFLDVLSTWLFIFLEFGEEANFLPKYLIETSNLYLGLYFIFIMIFIPSLIFLLGIKKGKLFKVRLWNMKVTIAMMSVQLLIVAWNCFNIALGLLYYS